MASLGGFLRGLGRAVANVLRGGAPSPAAPPPSPPPRPTPPVARPPSPPARAPERRPTPPRPPPPPRTIPPGGPMMEVPTLDGPVAMRVPGAKDRTLLSGYWSSVRRLAETGDAGRLHHFDGRAIYADGQMRTLLTDEDRLRELLDAGELSFEDIYSEESEETG